MLNEIWDYFVDFRFDSVDLYEKQSIASVLILVGKDFKTGLKWKDDMIFMGLRPIQSCVSFWILNPNFKNNENTFQMTDHKNVFHLLYSRMLLPLKYKQKLHNWYCCNYEFKPKIWCLKFILRGKPETKYLRHSSHTFVLFGFVLIRLCPVSFHFYCIIGRCSSCLIKINDTKNHL